MLLNCREVHKSALHSIVYNSTTLLVGAHQTFSPMIYRRWTTFLAMRLDKEVVVATEYAKEAFQVVVALVKVVSQAVVG